MLNFNDASQRLKMLLNILSETYGEKTPKGTVLRVRLIHQDLADMTGLTRETVTRVLDRWKKSGEIEVLSSKFIRLNDEFNSIEL
jgi:CRP/FNR family transcriptional regulator